VAGLVGIGLSDLWAASGLEGPEFAGEEVRVLCPPHILSLFSALPVAAQRCGKAREAWAMQLAQPCEQAAPKEPNCLQTV
jgi:hypothetical protein